MAQVWIFLGLVVLGLFWGTFLERAHFRSIRRREKALRRIKETNLKQLPVAEEEVDRSWVVMGSTVVSLDYFKKIVGLIINIFGGRIRAYEKLLERGRREAILRMKDQALDADYVINVRLETSCIGSNNRNQRNAVMGIEVIAYGMAVKIK